KFQTLEQELTCTSKTAPQQFPGRSVSQEGRNYSSSNGNKPEQCTTVHNESIAPVRHIGQVVRQVIVIPSCPVTSDPNVHRTDCLQDDFCQNCGRTQVPVHFVLAFHIDQEPYYPCHTRPRGPKENQTAHIDIVKPR